MGPGHREKSSSGRGAVGWEPLEAVHSQLPLGLDAAHPVPRLMR